MSFYCDRADVLRALGGTADQLEKIFGRSLWLSTPSTDVEVDGVDITVPDSVLARIDYQIEASDSRVDAYVLKAYRARPTTVPVHLREATARLAAFSTVSTDGAKAEWMREELKRAERYMRELADGKLDLGIETSEPMMRKPAAYFGRARRGGGC